MPLAALGRLERHVLEHDRDAGLCAHVRDAGTHHAGAEHDDLCRTKRFGPILRVPSTVTAFLLEVEEERLDHVLGDLSGDEVGKVPSLDLRGSLEVDLSALDSGGDDV